ncbi:MAG: hypothetical protein WC638_02155 [Candidatus Paceibacterota bacterium]
MAIGHTFKQVEEFLFDYLMYPAMIAALGTVIGGIIMSSLSASLCYLYINFYDWSKQDWLGLELLKEVRDGEDRKGRTARFVQKIARKSDWIAFFVLSCYTDPFVTTVYLRHGVEEYNGLSKRDWKVFWASVVVANVWWTIAMTLVVMMIRFLIKWLHT